MSSEILGEKGTTNAPGAASASGTACGVRAALSFLGGGRVSSTGTSTFSSIILILLVVILRFGLPSLADSSSNWNLLRREHLKRSSTRIAARPNTTMLPADEPEGNDTHLFGFYYQTYKSPKATLEVIKSLYRHMPEANVYMVSSDGYHYDPLVERFPRIHYIHEATHHDPRHARYNLSIWFDRVQAAALWCNCSYLIFLEDDLAINKPIIQRPPHDGGGQETVNKLSFPAESYDVFASRSSWSYNHSALAAGSYIKTSSFLDAYAHISWARIEAMLQFKPRTIGAYNDITLGVVMMDRGYIVRPWKEVVYVVEMGSTNVTFIHGNKTYYEQLLDPNVDGQVITEEEDRCAIFALKCKLERHAETERARNASRHTALGHAAEDQDNATLGAAP
jgi:hypothetical protein